MALPNGYKRLEYIQSSGKQYFDTGFNPNESTRVVMDCQFMGAESLPTPFGAWNSNGNANFVWCGANSSFTSWFPFYGTTYQSISCAISGRSVLDANKNAWYVNGNSFATFSAATFQTGYSLLLCAYHDGSNVANLTSLRIYSCQIYNNNTLVRDFVPARRISDNVYGLYDMVTDVFYTNAGSGTFAAGPEITEEISNSNVGGSRILVSGVGYNAAGGVCLAGGVGQKIEKGRAMVGGVGHDILFSDLPSVGIPLNDMTWEQIRAISDAGLAANYFSIGDTKRIVINGTVVETTFSNLSIDVFIIGIDHNSAREGTNKIHFQIGKINGTAVALCDSYYDNTNLTNATGKFVMFTTNTNKYGWEKSYMRTTVLGSDSTPSSPTANTLLAALPSDLRAVMKPVSKYTDNGYTNNTSTLTATTDYLWLLAENEVFGDERIGTEAESSYLVQYDYYKAGNSKIKCKHSSLTTAVIWWLRTRSGSNLTSMALCAESLVDLLFGNAAYKSYGISPAFAV